MSKLDQFESAFKSAAKDVYTFTDVELKTVLLVTDLDEERTRRFAADLQNFLSVLGDRDEVRWELLSLNPKDDVGDLLEHVERIRPDLICSYRNLHSRARSFPFSLGAYLDVLTQATTTPVLMLPVPSEEGRLNPRCTDTNEVMVLTDHLTGATHLIDCAARLTADQGKLVLAHLEDDATFERYMDTIGKIPAIDTDTARETIRYKLLDLASDYIDTVQDVLREHLPDVTIEKEVSMGHHVSDCQRLIERHEIDVVVLNTKDDDQLAMHGLAYPLAIELRQVPLLML